MKLSTLANTQVTWATRANYSRPVFTRSFSPIFFRTRLVRSYSLVWIQASALESKFVCCSYRRQKYFKQEGSQIFSLNEWNEIYLFDCKYFNILLVIIKYISQNIIVFHKNILKWLFCQKQMFQVIYYCWQTFLQNRYFHLKFKPELNIRYSFSK